MTHQPNNSQKFFLTRQIWRDIDVHFVNTTQNGTFVAAPVVIQRLTDEEAFVQTPAPMISIRDDAAQNLMDELWRIGLRPSEGTGSAGSLAATERHLADMRKIAFTFIEEPKPDRDITLKPMAPEDFLKP